MAALSDREFQLLLDFRVQMRRFDRWSESQAREVGLTHAQHQLLLAVKGHPDDRGPTIGEAADYLLLRHHSAVELVDRVAALGMVARVGDDTDARVVRLRLTDAGEQALAALTPLHLAELVRLSPTLGSLAAGLDDEPSTGSRR